MDENQIILDNCDVVLFCDDTCTHLNGKLTLVSRLIKTGCVSTGKTVQAFSDELFSNAGVKCLVLRPYGDGWRKGTLKFRLEFAPEEPITQPGQTDAVMSNQTNKLSNEHDEFMSSEIA